MPIGNSEAVAVQAFPENILSAKEFSVAMAALAARKVRLHFIGAVRQPAQQQQPAPSNREFAAPSGFVCDAARRI